MRTSFLYLIVLFLLSACHPKADLIIHNATIYTVDSTFSTAEAMAVKDGKILAIGKEDAIMKGYVSNSVFDAGKAAIYPGFIDAHAHFLSYGESLFHVNLMYSSSWEEVIKKVQDFAAAHPTLKWIRGNGWDQNRFPGKQFPDNKILDSLFPDKPVLLSRVDGHAAIANTYALKLAGIKPGQTIEGGQYVMENGQLTGLLIDNAKDALTSQIPPPTPDEFKNWMKQAESNCFAYGLTTITDCGLSPSAVDDLDRLQKKGDLRMRIYVMLSDAPESYQSSYFKNNGYVTDRLSVKGFKVYGDGALGSRGACLLQPYADKKDWTGFLLNPITHFDSIASMLSQTDFQMCTHAIGDSANRTILKVYAKYLKGKNDKRWRIEHAQIVNQEDFHFFGDYNIIPSVQPTHGTSDMYWAGDRVGAERLKGGYAFKRLLDQNGWIPLGTDFPVEEINPFKTFLAAVVRKDAQGFPANGFQMENALSREETIRGMTCWAAKANRMEKEIGSLETGKKADFIWLDQDLMKVKPENILKVKVLKTYLNGEQVY